MSRTDPHGHGKVSGYPEPLKILALGNFAARELLASIIKEEPQRNTITLLPSHHPPSFFQTGRNLLNIHPDSFKSQPRNRTLHESDQ
jgi:hypothetical protein